MGFPPTLLATAIPCSAVAAARPILGTRKLNIGKSSFSSGPAPRSQTRVYEMSPDGVIGDDDNNRCAREIVNQHVPGAIRRETVSGDGLGASTAMALPKVNDKTAAMTLTHAGVVIAAAERIISVDGNNRDNKPTKNLTRLRRTYPFNDKQ